MVESVAPEPLLKEVVVAEVSGETEYAELGGQAVDVDGHDVDGASPFMALGFYWELELAALEVDVLGQFGVVGVNDPLDVVWGDFCPDGLASEVVRPPSDGVFSDPDDQEVRPV